MLLVFAVTHSGLAALRPYAEEVVGARAWRVVFATISLPLALSCISYFINHCHEGMQLWNIPHDNAVLHAFFFLTNFISFLFFYPSTFNLLEIAAIETAPIAFMGNGHCSHYTSSTSRRTSLVVCGAYTMVGNVHGRGGIGHAHTPSRLFYLPWRCSSCTKTWNCLLRNSIQNFGSALCRYIGWTTRIATRLLQGIYERTLCSGRGWNHCCLRGSSVDASGCFSTWLVTLLRTTTK